MLRSFRFTPSTIIASRRVRRIGLRKEHTVTASDPTSSDEVLPLLDDGTEARKAFDRDNEDRVAVITPLGREKITMYTSAAMAALLPCESRDWIFLSQTFLSLFPQSKDAIIAAPSKMADIALGVLIPAHFWVGASHVIEDYIYKPTIRRHAKRSFAVWTILTTVAALHFNVKLGGLGLALRRFWQI